MFSLLQTLLFYDFIIIVCFISLYQYERTNRKFYKILPYCIIFFISVTRFDIGADYEGQYLTINEMLSYQPKLSLRDFIDDTAKTQGLSIIVFIFRGFPNVFLWVNGLYFFVFLRSIYFLLDRYNAHKWGILLLFLSLILFQSWDWIKQSAALGLVACSFVYIDQEKYKKAVFFLLGAIFFHLSALFAIPVLFFKKIKVPSRIFAFILLGIFIAAEIGIFKPLYRQLLVITPFYSDVYMSSMKYAEQESYSYLSTTYIFFSLWSIFIMFFSSRRTNFFNLLFFIGTVIYMISGGSLLLDRISIYYSISQLTIVPAIMDEVKQPLVKNILIYLILANLALINRRCFEYGDLRGCTPYETIFSDEFEHKKFRYREFFFN